MATPRRRIGILAGGGSLPLEFARAASARGELVQIVALEGIADAAFGSLPVTRVGMGEVGRMLRTFRAAGAREIVIIGPARRPDLKRLRLDLGFFRNLPAILRIMASGGDDGVLRGVVRFFESKGFRVLGPADVAPETLAPAGPLGAVAPDADSLVDIRQGLAVIRALGDLDVGQAVVVSDGVVEAIEGAEGTDGMLARVADQRARATSATPASRRGVLVKRPKPGQELRVDMPSIGPGTVSAAADAGLCGIAVTAGDVLVAERAEVVSRADARGLFVIGTDDPEGASRPKRGADAAEQGRLVPLGRHLPRTAASGDIATAARVREAARPFGCGHAVVVSRGYVLAVAAAGETAADVLSRVERLRRARTDGRRKRSGVALLAGKGDTREDIVAVAGRASLAGLAVPAGGPSPGADVVRACDQEGLFLVAWPDPGGRA